MCSSEYCFQSLCSILWWLWIKAPLMTNGGIWLCSDDSSEKDNCGHISITKNAKGNLFCFAVLQKTLGFLKTQKGESGLFTWSWTCYLYLFKIKVVTFLAEDLTPCSWSENSWRIKTAPSMTHQMPEEFFLSYSWLPHVSKSFFTVPELWHKDTHSSFQVAEDIAYDIVCETKTCIHVWTCGYMHMCACEYGIKRSTLGVFFLFSTSLLIRIFLFKFWTCVSGVGVWHVGTGI